LHVDGHLGLRLRWLWLGLGFGDLPDVNLCGRTSLEHCHLERTGETPAQERGGGEDKQGWGSMRQSPQTPQGSILAAEGGNLDRARKGGAI
jgi:hypothetical protein